MTDNAHDSADPSWAAGRGRDEDCSSPPAQIPACAANAPSSSLGSNVGGKWVEPICGPAHSRQSGSTWLLGSASEPRPLARRLFPAFRIGADHSSACKRIAGLHPDVRTADSRLRARCHWLRQRHRNVGLLACQNLGAVEVAAIGDDIEMVSTKNAFRLRCDVGKL